MFFSENQAKILAILINNPEKDFNLSELGTILGKHPGVFRRGISSLEKQEIILVSKRGNQSLLKINSSNPFLAEITGIIQKTIGVEGLLREMVNAIEDIDIALIYGSYARGEMRAESDIDVLIVTNSEKAEDELLDTIDQAENTLKRDINYKHYAQEEFMTKLKKNDPFLTEVLNNKYILLKGTINT